MIPVIILWNEKIRLSQKIFLGIFLCLNICMIILAIVRTSGLLLSNRGIDVQWEVFFQQVEASVSVITLSITALRTSWSLGLSDHGIHNSFRSLLGFKAWKFREKRERAWYFHRWMILFKKVLKTSESVLNEDQLPSMPSTTLTGMRTAIRGNRDSKNREADVWIKGMARWRRNIISKSLRKYHLSQTL